MFAIPLYISFLCPIILMTASETPTHIYDPSTEWSLDICLPAATRNLDTSEIPSFFEVGILHSISVSLGKRSKSYRCWPFFGSSFQKNKCFFKSKYISWTTTYWACRSDFMVYSQCLVSTRLVQLGSSNFGLSIIIFWCQVDGDLINKIYLWTVCAFWKDQQEAGYGPVGRES